MVVVVVVPFHQLKEQRELRAVPQLWSWLKEIPGVRGCMRKVVTFLEVLTFLELFLVLGLQDGQGAGSVVQGCKERVRELGSVKNSAQEKCCPAGVSPGEPTELIT